MLRQSGSRQWPQRHSIEIKERLRAIHHRRNWVRRRKRKASLVDLA
jgi:hypothetical protein